MSGILAVRDSIRDFLRKYDEVTTPLFRFLCSFIMFSCINSLFGYSDFFQRGIVTFLLSVISALVSGAVVVFLAGIVVAISCFSVSVDVGVLFLVLFIVLYCSYMRMFPDKGYVLALVPILYLLRIPFAAPVLVAVFAGFSGAVPAAFGVVLYYFSQYVRQAQETLLLAEDEDFQAYAYIVNTILKDKDMLLAVIAFAIVVMLTSLIYRMRFDYAWYVAIGVGSILTILIFMVCGMVIDVDVPMGSLVLGAVLAAVIGCIVQVCKGIVDYSRKESVQFEDDDYYYYVKAIPKFNVAQKNKSVKNMTEEEQTSNKRTDRNEEARQRVAQRTGQTGNSQRRTGQTDRAQGTGRQRADAQNGSANRNRNGQERR